MSKIEDIRKKFEMYGRVEGSLDKLEVSRPEVISTEGGVLIRDVKCVGADEGIFESYPEIYVPTEISEGNSVFGSFKPYNAITYFEERDMLLPSFALTCNILAALYENLDNPDAEKIFQQYKKYDETFTGMLVQNTVIDWINGQIIHYPHEGDFSETPNIRSAGNVNNEKSAIVLDAQWGRGGINLEETLKDPQTNEFLRNLTGLPEPELLEEISDYFGKDLSVMPPTSTKYLAATWLGCDELGFNVCIYEDLSHRIGRARGVKLR